MLNIKMTKQLLLSMACMNLIITLISQCIALRYLLTIRMTSLLWVSFISLKKEKRSIYLVDEDLRSEYLKAKHSSIEGLMSTIDGNLFKHEGV
ncbi:MAG TPA: hypothetical protein DCQ89_02020 [Psychrobacter sp.]|nr:hypothetical protein [Psychrobacter sp.]